MEITRKKYFLFIISMLMASSFMPLVFNNLPPIIGSHHIWTLIWGASLLLFSPSVFKTKGMIIVILYGIFLTIGMTFFWSSMDNTNKVFLLLEYYQIFIGASIFSYLMLVNDYEGWAVVTKWTLIFVFITGIMTIISATIDPMYARNLIGASGITNEEKKDSVLFFQRYGGGAYGYAIAFMAFIPLIVFYFKNNAMIQLRKGYILVFFLVVVIALIGMQIFTNILIAYFSIILAFIGYKAIRSYILICIGLVVIYSIPQKVYVDVLMDIGGVFEVGSELNYKFTDMAYFIENNETIEDASTGAGGRANRYPMLWKAFSQGPSLGCFHNNNDDAYSESGLHLYWMNKLTTTGVVGLICFIIIPLYYFRLTINSAGRTIRYYLILGLLSILLYGMFKSVLGREVWYSFFVIIPGISYLPLVMNKNKDM